MIITGRIDNAVIDRLNRLLIDFYGIGFNDLPYFRVVWSDDMFELRKRTSTDAGVQLLIPKIMNSPKYKGFIEHKYVLESLTIITEYAQTDMALPYSYEPKFVFEDKAGNALYPRWDAMYLILESIRANIQGAGFGQVKYKDPTTDPVTGALAAKAELDRVQQELFGNESDITDALKLKSGIVVPGQV
jgi:hypothetical protein